MVSVAQNSQPVQALTTVEIPIEHDSVNSYRPEWGVSMVPGAGTASGLHGMDHSAPRMGRKQVPLFTQIDS